MVSAIEGPTHRYRAPAKAQDGALAKIVGGLTLIIVHTYSFMFWSSERSSFVQGLTSQGLLYLDFGNGAVDPGNPPLVWMGFRSLLRMGGPLKCV